MVQESPESWLVTDASGVVREASAEAAQLLHLASSFLVGKPLSLLVTPHHVRALFAHLQALHTGQGETPWPLLLHAPGGGTIEALGQLADEQPGASGTAAVHWRLRLRQPPAVREPTMTSITLGPQVFFTAMSHELLTPVAIIRGYAEALRGLAEQGDAGPLTQGLVAIEEESLRLQRLLQNTIDVARMAGGELPVTILAIPLEPLITKSVERFGGRSRRHHFDALVPPNLPLVLADPARVEGVLYNLLDNALKYSPGGGRVLVAVTAHAAEVEVAITDEGVGIPTEDQPYLFEPYYRGQAPIRTRADGIGMGLYLCRAIIEAHGGQLGVSSTMDQGSRFTFTLRRADAPAVSRPSGAAQN